MRLSKNAERNLVIRASKMRLMSLNDPKLADVASKVLGKTVRIKAQVDDTIQAAAPAASAAQISQQNDDVRERALSHPGVKRFQELFPDAQVRTVRNLND